MTCDQAKVCYETPAAAAKVGRHLRKKRNNARIYYCKECVAFHITTKKKNQKYDRSKTKRGKRKINHH